MRRRLFITGICMTFVSFGFSVLCADYSDKNAAYMELYGIWAGVTGAASFVLLLCAAESKR